MALTKQQLLARTNDHVEVELSGGGSVIVRGMTRGEAAAMRDLDQSDVIGLEAHALATCMIEPALTVAEARAWLENEQHNEIQKVVDAIERKNGAAAGQPKGYTKSVRRR